MAKGRIYNKKRWKLLRLEYLIEHPVCEICKSSFSCDVDHIKAINDGGDPWDMNNLQALCHSCHSIKTASKDHGFGNKSGSKDIRPKGCTVDGLPLDINNEWRTYHEK